MGKLKKREFAYEILPGPPAELIDGGEAELNLVAWPRGRSLTDEMYPGEVLRRNKALPVQKDMVKITILSDDEKRELFNLATTADQLAYLEAKRTLAGSEKDRDNLAKLEAGIANAYNERVMGFYNLYDRPTLHYSYAEVCSGIGSKDAENEFMETSFCYVKGEDGKYKEVTLKEFFSRYAPKNNPKVRTGNEVTDSSSDENKRRSRSRTKVFVP
jgi:hypothetical protein